jgi:2-C-methyl-D-erythritol 4-phosphate cytidylyltransferase
MPRHFVVIPAAGIGQRMGAQADCGPLPKQYLRLVDKTLLEHSVAAFLGHPSIELVVVAIASEDERARQVLVEDDRLALVACGGSSRQETVLNALVWLEAQVAQDSAGDVSSSWVLVHDAARPGLTQNALVRLIEHAHLGSKQGWHGAILALPIVDTLKHAHTESNVVLNSPSREGMWAAQTPQMFPLSALRTALAECASRGLTVTDEATAMDEMGFKVGLVQGERRNLKITVPEDLEWLEAMWMR